MRSYSKRRGKGRRSRRQKRQRGGQWQPPDVSKFIQDAVDKMKTMSLQDLKRTMASGFRKYILLATESISRTNISQPPPSLTYLIPAISTFIQSNTPAEFSAFTGKVNLVTAILLVIADMTIPEYNAAQNPPPPAVTNAKLASGIQTFFSTFKTISPADALEKSAAGIIKMSDIQAKLMADPTLRSQFDALSREILPQFSPGIGSQFINITPDELMAYPVWDRMANEEMNMQNMQNPGTNLFLNLVRLGQVMIFLPLVESILNSTASSSSSTSSTQPSFESSTSSTSTQPSVASSTSPQSLFESSTSSTSTQPLSTSSTSTQPSSTSSTSTQPSSTSSTSTQPSSTSSTSTQPSFASSTSSTSTQPSFASSITTQSSSTSTRPSSTSSTSTRPPSRIPAGMIAWLNANRNTLTNSQKTKVTAAINFIKQVYPTLTTTQLVQQEVGKLSVQTSGTPIPAAMVSWLNAQLSSTPNNLKSKVRAASTYIKQVWSSQTTLALVQAAANKLIML